MPASICKKLVETGTLRFCAGNCVRVLPRAWLFYGYIDPSDRMVVPPQFDEAHNFSDGLALVVRYQQREWAYVDKPGNVVGMHFLVGTAGAIDNLP
jgi:hypothetical protein